MERERSSLLTVRGDPGLTPLPSPASFSLSSKLASSDLLLALLELADKFLCSEGKDKFCLIV